MAVSTRRKYSPRLPRAERREQLLDATLRLIAEHGYAGVSIEAVAREADIAKSVVYESFGNQRELEKALFEREQERVLSAIAAALPTPPLAGDPAEILAASITTLLEAVGRNPDTWRLVVLPADGTPPALREEVNRHRERLVGQIEPMVDWATEHFALPALDSELSAHAILAGCEDAVRLTLTHPRRFPPSRVAAFAAQLVAALGRGPAS
jgi:AcrR family transcriptional regulator